MQRKTISMARLVKNPEAIAKNIESSRVVYSIKRPGRRTMLLMDEEYFEGWRVVIELMQRPNWREELDQSRRDFSDGRARDLEEIAREMGLDRRAQSRRSASAAGSSRSGRKASVRRSSRSRSRAA